jgi:hypothetical protein
VAFFSYDVHTHSIPFSSSYILHSDTLNTPAVSYILHSHTLNTLSTHPQYLTFAHSQPTRSIRIFATELAARLLVSPQLDPLWSAQATEEECDDVDGEADGAQSPTANSPAAAGSAKKASDDDEGSDDDEPCAEEAAKPAAEVKLTGQIGTLFDVLLRRCRDKSVTVRSKALAGISKALAVPLEALGMGTDKNATATGSAGSGDTLLVARVLFSAKS